MVRSLQPHRLEAGRVKSSPAVIDGATIRLWRTRLALPAPFFSKPSPTIGQCSNGGYGWLQVKCHRCETEASIPLDAIRRPRDTPIWKLEAALKCRLCRKGRYAPPVHMIKLTETRQTNPYRWVHPDEDRRMNCGLGASPLQ